MATYKVKATYSVDVEIEIDAATEEEAISKLIQTDFRTVIENGNIMRADSEDETAELAEADFRVKVSDIEYEITEEDLYLQGELDEDYVDEEKVEKYIEQIRSELPTEMIIEVKNVSPEDLNDYVIDEVSEKTGWLINSLSWEILETK